MKSLCAIALAAALALPTALLADAGHDHGEIAAAPTAPAAPRFEAHSELFELVGVLENGKLTLYLDRYRDNAPVTGARLEVEGEAFQGEAASAAEGTYTLPGAPFAKPGRHALTFTVTAAEDTDLLNGVLEVAAPGKAPAASAEIHHAWQYWPLALGIAAFGIAMFFAGRARKGASTR